MSDLPSILTSDILGGETSFSVDNFKSNKISNRMEALARKIEFLLITEKGTYPDDPDLGIGVKTYIFEFKSDVLSQLRSEINTQVKKYLPDAPIKTISVDTTTKNGFEFIYVVFTITDEEKPLTFILGEYQGNVLSKMVI